MYNRAELLENLLKQKKELKKELKNFEKQEKEKEKEEEEREEKQKREEEEVFRKTALSSVVPSSTPSLPNQTLEEPSLPNPNVRSSTEALSSGGQIVQYKSPQQSLPQNSERKVSNKSKFYSSLPIYD